MASSPRKSRRHSSPSIPTHEPEIRLRISFESTSSMQPEPTRRRTTIPRFIHSSANSNREQPPNSSKDSASFIAPGKDFDPAVRMPTKRKASFALEPEDSTSASNRVEEPLLTYDGRPLFKLDSLVHAAAVSEARAYVSVHPDLSRILLPFVNKEVRTILKGYTAGSKPTTALSNNIVQMGEKFRRKFITKKPSALLFCVQEDPSFRDLRYLPLVLARNSSPSSTDMVTVTAGQVDGIGVARALASPSIKRHWPADGLPLEVFEHIMQYLHREDWKSMRLVSKVFEHNVTPSVFHTSVVPFNTELYDMIGESRCRRPSLLTPIEATLSRFGILGRSQTRVENDTAAGMYDNSKTGVPWQNANEDKNGKTYKGQGLRVFSGLGDHIRRFGMSFEVAEDQLAQPPAKEDFYSVDAYHGSYTWPPQHYARFANLAGLEQTADESSRMQLAFSYLENVEEIALSLDSGLGWLSGPDKSLRSAVFHQPSAVFYQSNDAKSQAMEKATHFWDALVQSHNSMDAGRNLKEVVMSQCRIEDSAESVSSLGNTIAADVSKWPSICTGQPFSPLQESESRGIRLLYTTEAVLGETRTRSCALTPAALKKEQKEWLLEVRWAQRAFLESYILAIIDNPDVFSTVNTLTIPKLSSSFLLGLVGSSLWKTLSSLSNLTLLVSPDWRDVVKDAAGLAQTPTKDPIDALSDLSRLLREQLCKMDSLRTLQIGWCDGGEHAQGMFARNSNIMPSPMDKPKHSLFPQSSLGVVFKHLAHLTLTNCWMHPGTLERLVTFHDERAALRKLTLDSVSIVPLFPDTDFFARLAAAQQAAQQAAQHAAHSNPRPSWVTPNVVSNHTAAAHLPLPPFVNPNFVHNHNAAQNAAQLQPPMNQPGLPHGNQIALGAFPAAQNQQTFGHWTQGIPVASWPSVLSRISRGPAPSEPQQDSRRHTRLQTLEFKSCGYAVLPARQDLDQLHWNVHPTFNKSSWFQSRRAQLGPAMMQTGSVWLGNILQYMDPRELYVLQMTWGLTEGWTEGAEDPEYDGCLPGGTGRFSGVVERELE